VGGFLSPRDIDGHGTHTLSMTVANFVENATTTVYAEGIAKGGAPLAIVAAYKVCWLECKDADILAAFDDGVHDRVDVFFASLGSNPPLSDYFQKAVAIRAFHAVQRGKVVICSA